MSSQKQPPAKIPSCAAVGVSIVPSFVFTSTDDLLGLHEEKDSQLDAYVKGERPMYSLAETVERFSRD